MVYCQTRGFMSLKLCKKLHRTGELRCRVTNFGPQIHGLIYRSRKGTLYIMADESLSPEARTAMCIRLPTALSSKNLCRSPRCFISKRPRPPSRKKSWPMFLPIKIFLIHTRGMNWQLCFKMPLHFTACHSKPCIAMHNAENAGHSSRPICKPIYYPLPAATVVPYDAHGIYIVP